MKTASLLATYRQRFICWHRLQAMHMKLCPSLHFLKPAPQDRILPQLTMINPRQKPHQKDHKDGGRPPRPIRYFYNPRIVHTNHDFEACTTSAFLWDAVPNFYATLDDGCTPLISAHIRAFTCQLRSVAQLPGDSLREDCRVGLVTGIVRMLQGRQHVYPSAVVTACMQLTAVAVVPECASSFQLLRRKWPCSVFLFS